jgi:hypothetical protein
VTHLSKSAENYVVEFLIRLFWSSFVPVLIGDTRICATAAHQDISMKLPDLKNQALSLLTGMASVPPLIMKLAMPVSPYPTFPRTREKGQTNRCASFTLTFSS